MTMSLALDVFWKILLLLDCTLLTYITYQKWNFKVDKKFQSKKDLISSDPKLEVGYSSSISNNCHF